MDKDLTGTQGFYLLLLEHEVRKRRLKKPEGGLEQHVREHFKDKAGDYYYVDLWMRTVCHLEFQERQLFSDVYGFSHIGASPTEQIIRNYKLGDEAGLKRRLNELIEKVAGNRDMMKNLYGLHPEVWLDPA